MTMKDECIICKAPLEYLERDTEMECVICHKRENSKTRCVNGHYVCNESTQRELAIQMMNRKHNKSIKGDDCNGSA